MPKNPSSAVAALLVCTALVAVLVWMRVGSHIGDTAFVLCFGTSLVASLGLYRIEDVTELAVARGASVKLKRAKEISDGVAEVAKQLVILFETKDCSEPFDQKAHDKMMRDTLAKIKSLTRR